MWEVFCRGLKIPEFTLKIQSTSLLFFKNTENTGIFKIPKSGQGRLSGFNLQVLENQRIEKSGQ